MKTWMANLLSVEFHFCKRMSTRKKKRTHSIILSKQWCEQTSKETFDLWAQPFENTVQGNMFVEPPNPRKE